MILLLIYFVNFIFYLLSACSGADMWKALGTKLNGHLPGVMSPDSPQLTPGLDVLFTECIQRHACDICPLLPHENWSCILDENDNAIQRWAQFTSQVVPDTWLSLSIQILSILIILEMYTNSFRSLEILLKQICKKNICCRNHYYCRDTGCVSFYIRWIVVDTVVIVTWFVDFRGLV